MALRSLPAWILAMAREAERFRSEHDFGILAAIAPSHGVVAWKGSEGGVVEGRSERIPRSQHGFDRLLEVGVVTIEVFEQFAGLESHDQVRLGDEPVAADHADASAR